MEWVEEENEMSDGRGGEAEEFEKGTSAWILVDQEREKGHWGRGLPYNGELRWLKVK